MNEIYLDIFIQLQSDQSLRDALVSSLLELGCTGFLEEEDGIHAYLPKKYWNENRHTTLTSAVTSLGLPELPAFMITELQQQNWNAEWEKSIRPIKVSDRITITPSWHPIPLEGNAIVLTIDPKMSFGTGYHESTRIMLRMMEERVRTDMNVLDVGTGTGILAIGAVKLGAAHAIGIDIDEWASTNGNENIERNGVQGKVEIRTGSLETVQEGPFDLVLANIIRMTIIDLLPPMLQKLSPQGLLLLSGLMESDTNAMETALSLHQCRILSTNAENEWIGLTVGRIA